jgi:hypothetical protein
MHGTWKQHHDTGCASFLAHPDGKAHHTPFEVSSFLAVACACVSFGTVHVESSCTITLFLSNPTVVDAVRTQHHHHPPSTTTIIITITSVTPGRPPLPLTWPFPRLPCVGMVVGACSGGAPPAVVGHRALAGPQPHPPKRSVSQKGQTSRCILIALVAGRVTRCPVMRPALALTPISPRAMCLSAADDAKCFVFSCVSGCQRGPSLPLKSSAACIPEDFNRR